MYFAYELWQSKKVSLNAESGTDIATGVQVSATGPLSSGEGNVNYTKATKEKIDIDAATPVNFALRLVRLDVDFQTQAITAKWLGRVRQAWFHIGGVRANRLSSATRPSLLKKPSKCYL